MPLARLAMLKSNAFLKEAASDWDDDLKVMLKAATETVNTFTGRRLELDLYENALYTGNDTNRLWLRQWPVVDVTLLELWDSATKAYVEEDDDYYFLIRNRFLQYPALGQEANSAWAKWKSDHANGIRITYVAGYDTEGWDTAGINLDFNVPPDLEHVTLVIAQLMWMDGKKGGARRGITTMSVGMESLTIEKYVNELPKDVTCILANYRRL